MDFSHVSVAIVEFDLQVEEEMIRALALFARQLRFADLATAPTTPAGGGFEAAEQLDSPALRAAYPSSPSGKRRHTVATSSPSRRRTLSMDGALPGGVLAAGREGSFTKKKTRRLSEDSIDAPARVSSMTPRGSAAAEPSDRGRPGQLETRASTIAISSAETAAMARARGGEAVAVVLPQAQPVGGEGERHVPPREQRRARRDRADRGPRDHAAHPEPRPRAAAPRRSAAREHVRVARAAAGADPPQLQGGAPPPGVPARATRRAARQPRRPRARPRRRPQVARVFLPTKGLLKSPEEFGRGLINGTWSLARAGFGGTAKTAGHLAGALGTGLATLSMDSEYLKYRPDQEAPQHVLDGLMKGGVGLGRGVVEGLTGIISAPIEGAQREGGVGFLKGMGKGLAGAIVKPAAGVFDLASGLTQGIANTFEFIEGESADGERVRPPRMLARPRARAARVLALRGDRPARDDRAEQGVVPPRGVAPLLRPQRVGGARSHRGAAGGGVVVVVQGGSALAALGDRQRAADAAARHLARAHAQLRAARRRGDRQVGRPRLGDQAAARPAILRAARGSGGAARSPSPTPARRASTRWRARVTRWRSPSTMPSSRRCASAPARLGGGAAAEATSELTGTRTRTATAARLPPLTLTQSVLNEQSILSSAKEGGGGRKSEVDGAVVHEHAGRALALDERRRAVGVGRAAHRARREAARNPPGVGPQRDRERGQRRASRRCRSRCRRRRRRASRRARRRARPTRRAPQVIARVSHRASALGGGSQSSRCETSCGPSGFDEESALYALREARRAYELARRADDG